MFLLWLRQLPWCGDWIPASVPPPTEGRSIPTNTPVFPPSSFILPSFSWFCIFFSTGQALLSTLSWCSACTSVSEGVFLMHPWREMHFMSTYSSAILFSLSSSFYTRHPPVTNPASLNFYSLKKKATPLEVWVGVQMTIWIHPPRTSNFIEAGITVQKLL